MHSEIYLLIKHAGFYLGGGGGGGGGKRGNLSPPPSLQIGSKQSNSLYNVQECLVFVIMNVIKNLTKYSLQVSVCLSVHK